MSDLFLRCLAPPESEAGGRFDLLLSRRDSMPRVLAAATGDQRAGRSADAANKFLLTIPSRPALFYSFEDKLYYIGDVAAVGVVMPDVAVPSATGMMARCAECVCPGVAERIIQRCLQDIWPTLWVIARCSRGRA
jgi:hypothetical protein